MKEKDLTSSSVHLYRRRIILGKIPPQWNFAMAERWQARSRRR